MDDQTTSLFYSRAVMDFEFKHQRYVSRQQYQNRITMDMVAKLFNKGLVQKPCWLELRKTLRFLSFFGAVTLDCPDHDLMQLLDCLRKAKRFII